MPNKITFATPDMLSALKKIWVACFGDEGGYADHVFAHLLTPERILVVADEDGEPLSMACMRPFTLSARGDEAGGMYLFGVATDPGQQGKGHSTALLGECHRVLTERGAALSVLVPASESLFGFYGARGYGPFASVKKAKALFQKREPPSSRLRVSPADPDSLFAMRNRFYAGRDYVRWDSEYLRYIAGECRMLGGDVLLLSSGDERGYAVCYPAGKQIAVKELVVAERLMPDAAAAILAHFGRKECVVNLPEDTPADCPNKVLPFAMVRWYDREKQTRMRGCSPYIAHVLDD